MMIELWPKAFFTLLNTGLLCAIAYRLVRYRVIPAMRASLAHNLDEVQQLTSDIKEQKNVLVAARQRAYTQEQEIARMTAAIEKWKGVLSQRATTADVETRELSFRYKIRCEDNARARVNQRVHDKVTKRVLHDVRKALVCMYEDPKNQQNFMDHVCAQMVHKDIHD